MSSALTNFSQTVMETLKRLAGFVRSGVGALKARVSNFGLSGKLLLITIGFATIVELLIFLPAITNYRIDWLNDRIGYAYVSALAAEAAPGGYVPPGIRNELLRTALVRTVAIRRGGRRRLILPPVMDISIDATYDLRPPEADTVSAALWQRLRHVRDALHVYFTNEERTLRLVGFLGPRRDDIIEVVLPEAPLKRAMQENAWSVFGLSIVISVLLAALVYWALSALLVRPLSRLTRNMLNFSEDPEDPERIIQPSGRNDEIGTAEHELHSMQKQLSQLLLQKTRLAQLGLAVSKVNHDLRNMLANAQLISDRLADIPDPTVQKFAPKLIASLDRAINFCNDTLKFGRAQEAHPRRELLRLKPIVVDVGQSLGLPGEDGLAWVVDIDDNLRIDADREHLFRILVNLVRNAIQAIESEEGRSGGTVTVRGWRDGRKVSIEVSDDGPGLPPAARKYLFQAFQGSTRKGGTGLGLAIAAELVAAHSGKIALLDTQVGATFLIEIPDRAAT